MSYCPKNKTQATSSEKGSKHRYVLLPEDMLPGTSRTFSTSFHRAWQAGRKGRKRTFPVYRDKTRFRPWLSRGEGAIPSEPDSTAACPS